MARKGWMHRIANQESRDDAREVFGEWLEMQANVNDTVTFVERTNDVGVLHVEAGEPNTPNVDDHTARDLVDKFGRGANPVRCIDVTGVKRGVVQLNMLLAELRVENMWGKHPRESHDAE